MEHIAMCSMKTVSFSSVMCHIVLPLSDVTHLFYPNKRQDILNSQIMTPVLMIDRLSGTLFDLVSESPWLAFRM
jgi:hypothetical protein